MVTAPWAEALPIRSHMVTKSDITIKHSMIFPDSHSLHGPWHAVERRRRHGRRCHAIACRCSVARVDAVRWRPRRAGACRAPKNGPAAALGRLPGPQAAALTATSA